MERSGWKQYLGTKEFYKHMAMIAIPVSLQQLITVGINLMDTLMLSHMGDAQLSAAAQAGQFINLFQIFCMGIGMGASVLTSRYWGMQDILSLRKAVTIMLRFCMIFVGVFMVATLCVPDAIMRLYSLDGEIIDYGVVYLQYMVPTYFCMGMSLTCTIVLRTVGQVRIPLACSIGAFFVNVFFNWVFIFGNLGAPRMEIAGAALGTLIARIFELLFICGYFFLRDQRIGYRFRHLLMRCGDLSAEYFRICIPVLISDGLLALGNNAVAMIMGRIGRTFVAANAMTMVVQQLSSVFTQGISNASGIITGHTMGQGDFATAQRQGYTFLGLGLVLGCLGGLLIVCLKDVVINYYQVSLETKEIAGDLMDAIGFIIIFQSMNSILTKGVLRAGGDTKFLMAGDILFLWVASIPLGALAGLVWHASSFWVYTLLKIDQIIKCVWCFGRLKSRKWMKRIAPAAQADA